MEDKNRPPFEGLYIYAFLLLVAFIIADLATLKTQLYLENQNSSRTASSPRIKNFSPGEGLKFRTDIAFERYKPIIDRNLFNADGLIPPPLSRTGDEQSFDDETGPVKTDLPLQLIGTIVHANPYRSIASLQLQGDENPAALKVGGQLKDLLDVLGVFRRRVIFRNLKNQRLEFAEIPEDPMIRKRREAEPPPVLQNSGGPAIKRSGNDFTVSRRDVKAQLNDYQSLLRTARAIPYTDPNTGELIGFKVTRLLPGSLFQKLGIQPGDVIKEVNGQPMNSINKALEVFGSLKGDIDSLNNVKINVGRGGSDQSLNYNVGD